MRVTFLLVTFNLKSLVFGEIDGGLAMWLIHLTPLNTYSFQANFVLNIIRSTFLFSRLIVIIRFRRTLYENIMGM